MTATDEPGRATARLRERMERLSSASLRISESLDLESVLREVVDSARVLTGAGSSAITTVDQVEGVRDWVETEPFQSGELRIRYDRREVTVAGRPVALTATEYELLRVLAVNAGRVVTRDVLLRRIWGIGAGRKTEALRTCVKKLRRKLGGSGASPSYIFNERGVGYRLAVPTDHLATL